MELRGVRPQGVGKVVILERVTAEERRFFRIERRGSPTNFHHNFPPRARVSSTCPGSPDSRPPTTRRHLGWTRRGGHARRATVRAGRARLGRRVRPNRVRRDGKSHLAAGGGCERSRPGRLRPGKILADYAPGGKKDR